MFRNYLTVAIRNLIRNKSFSLINISGLALGMAISIMIFLYVFNELSYDDFHKNKDRIYRVLLKEESNEGKSDITAVTNAVAGPSMLKAFPEVENMVRFSNATGGFVNTGDKNFNIRLVSYTDSSIFDVFSFKLIKGDPEKALSMPYTAVLTEKTAEKLFGNDNPLGQTIRYNNSGNYLITGVVEDPPANSHIRFDMLLSFSTLYKKPDVYLDWDGGYNYFTYVLLRRNISLENLKSKFPGFMEEHINKKYREAGWFITLLIEPLKDVHLYSVADYDIATKGSLTQIYIFASIALFILLIACVNFINLSTARSVKRAKEVGIRKVTGATKQQLIIQFLGESILVAFVSMIFALLIIELIQPEFNRLTGSELNLFTNSNSVILLLLFPVTLFAGLVAGSLPAFYMSRFQPVAILKGYFASATGKPILRNILVTFQFFISVILIISTVVIILQLRYVNNRDLGFNKENLILVELNGKTAMEKSAILKSEFGTIPGVEGVAASTSYPGAGLTMNGYFPEGYDHSIMIHVMDVDYDYLDILGLKTVQGRSFSKDYGTDSSAYLINETLAKQLGWDNPIGKYISRDGKHKVIGVVKDFNFSSLHEKIGPLIITVKPWDYYYYLSVKIDPAAKKDIAGRMEKVWDNVVSGEPFTWYYLDSQIAAVYGPERRIARTFVYMAFISIFIACLGLYGQAAYSTGQRTKEIGIRKVFGATVANILTLLSQSFGKIILVANIIAWPVAWFVMSQWLSTFAFHISITWWIFASALLLSILISAFTILYQALKASRTNPVNALKYE